MGIELEWLLKEGGGHIFLLIGDTSYTVYTVYPWLHTQAAAAFFYHALAYAIKAVHLLVPPIAQCCFFGVSCHNCIYHGIN